MDPADAFAAGEVGDGARDPLHAVDAARWGALRRAEAR